MRNNNKQSILLIAAIMVAVATAFFLVVDITVLFITAYLFALLGIALLSFSKIYLINNLKNYPWIAAFPMTAFRYLVIQLGLSAGFVITENLVNWSLPIQWFLLFHIILLALFTIILLAMSRGKEIINQRDATVKEKVTTLRFMQVDAESLLRQSPEHEQDIKQVLDALRYSDPMSHSSLTVYDEQIQRGLMDLKNDGVDVPKQCAELLRLIADRNSRVKAMK